jgi:hypothetical protein
MNTARPADTHNAAIRAVLPKRTRVLSQANMSPARTLPAPVAAIEDPDDQASGALLAVLVMRNVGWSPGSGSARNVRPTVGSFPNRRKYASISGGA